MKLADFNIGEKFVTASGEWLCTDKGMRVAVGIKLDKSDASWYNGPPYAVTETVFDEYDMQSCWQTLGLSTTRYMRCRKEINLMSQQNLEQPLTPEREREAAEARAELMRLAEEQGVKPFNFDEAFGEGSEGQSQEEIRQEVDEFLKIVRETRDMPSARSIE